jgi:hypothetical protein
MGNEHTARLAPRIASRKARFAAMRDFEIGSGLDGSGFRDARSETGTGNPEPNKRG